jgi:hypothetical protein
LHLLLKTINTSRVEFAELMVSLSGLDSHDS